MKKIFKNLLFIFVFPFELTILNSKIIQTKDLSSALSSASPGDTIKLESGIYNSVPYRLKSIFLILVGYLMHLLKDHLN